MKLSEYLETLEGQEILSVTYEGCVGVKDGYVIRGGERIEKLNKTKAEKLFNELFENEFGASDVSGLL